MMSLSKKIEKVTFVTYGDRNFHNSKYLLAREASAFGFRNIVVESPETLPEDFKNKHSQFLSLPRGGGYWLWKSAIVRKNLRSLRDNDILLYADAGCSINQNGRGRFSEWLQMCNDHDSLSFQMHVHPEKHWSKMSLVHYLECNDPKYLETGQINATVFLLKKTSKVVEMIDTWFNVCSLEWTIDDTSSTIANDPEFKDHRHDQSVFSLIRKKEGCFTINDETYPSLTHNWNEETVRYTPVLATRRRF